MKKSIAIPSPTDLTAAKKVLSEHSPARIFRDRVGTSLGTRNQLELRWDHAVASDAVWKSCELAQLLDSDLVERFRILPLTSKARDRRQYLNNPGLGRILGDESATKLSQMSHLATQVQIIIGDGLSIDAVKKQVPLVLPRLMGELQAESLSCGTPIFVKNCRVGILNHVGEILKPEVAVLLIGERPGLSTAESLSAYMAYRPNHAQTDANRNLISNIHQRGINTEDAAKRIVRMIKTLLSLKLSGVDVKEDILDSQITDL